MTKLSNRIYALSMVAVAALLLLSVSCAATFAGDTGGQAGCAHPGPDREKLAGMSVGERIAAWAESFVGTPYDTIPIGLYVESEKVVCDSEVDCMYLVFRSAELGTTDTETEAYERALDLRFITKGVVEGGRVVNYDDRFQYAEDMIGSGKWGKDVTASLGRTEDIPGDRGRDTVTILPKEEAAKPESLSRLKSGDIVYFVKDPSKRVVGEIIGHLGIVKVEDEGPMLIHASGTKTTKSHEGGGVVKKVSLADYLGDTKFIGIQVTRFPG